MVAACRAVVLASATLGYGADGGSLRHLASEAGILGAVMPQELAPLAPLVGNLT